MVNKEKHKAASAAWYAANKEHADAVSKAWRKKNVKKITAYNKAWREKNMAKVKAIDKVCRDRNAKQRAAASRAWYAANKEHAKAVGKIWYKANGAHRRTVSNATRTKRLEQLAGRKKPKRCDVCKRITLSKLLHYDHDHKTGLFRGWLCNHCNFTLGHARDSAKTLRKLADYLDADKAKHRRMAKVQQCR